MEDSAVVDPDFEANDNISSSSDSDFNPKPDSSHNDENIINEDLEEGSSVEEVKSKKRSKHPQRSKWKQNVVKSKRLKGLPYTNKKGQVKAQKTLGPPCTSTYCQKSKLRSCHLITEDQREWIFNRFWSMESWAERRSYIQALISVVSVNIFTIS